LTVCLYTLLVFLAFIIILIIISISIVIITARQHDETQIPQYLVDRHIKPISESLNDSNK